MAPSARIITVAFDMSKAFDTINILTLIRKMLQTNIRGTIIKLISNYIKRCNAYTTYRNHTSIHSQFKTGVPQGGVLSPTLFNIHPSRPWSTHSPHTPPQKGFNQMAPSARIITVAFDMSKAFDTINILTLIRKMLQTNIRGTIIKLISNYIKRCNAYTTYRNHTSIHSQFKTGVPQGGVLSPTPFNIYTADLPPEHRFQSCVTQITPS